MSVEMLAQMLPASIDFQALEKPRSKRKGFSPTGQEFSTLLKVSRQHRKA